MYVKLFGTILYSTIWGASATTRVVWITLLAMADEEGNVYTTIPGLARAAAVTIEETEHAITEFQTPDPYSSSKAEGGRRVIPFDGGFHLVNYQKYRELRTLKQRQTAARVQRHRARKEAERSVTSVTRNDGSVTRNDVTTYAETDTEAETEAEEKIGGEAPPIFCSEPREDAPSEPPPDEPDPVLTIEAIRGETWALTPELLAAWEDTYPGIDVLAEGRRARAWLDANPTRRKTRRGMKRFLVNWLNRAQDRGAPRSSRQLTAHERSLAALEEVYREDHNDS